MRYKLAFDHDKDGKFRVTVLPLLEDRSSRGEPYVCRFNSHADFMRRVTAAHLSPFNTARLLEAVVRTNAAHQSECCEEIGLPDGKLLALGLLKSQGQSDSSEAA
jgi:hypothetical protein